MDLDRFFELSLDLLCVAGHDGYFKKVNPAATRILGYSEQELLTRSFLEIVHPDDRASTQEVLGALLQGDVLMRFANRFVAAGGSVRWLEWTATPVDDGLIYASARDVTDRRRADKELERLAMIAARTSNGILLTDVKGRIEWVNEGFTRITGYNLDEVRGKTPGSVLQGPRTNNAAIARMREQLKSGQGFSEELLNFRKSGEEYWTAVEVQPIRDSSGRVTAYMAVESDITLRKRAEEELRRNEEQLRRTSAMAKVGGWELDLDTRVPVWSNELRRIREVPDDYVPNLQDDIAAFVPEARRVVTEAIEETAQTGEGWDLEVPLTTAAGREIWVRFICQARRKDGQVTSLSGSFQDITDRKKTEDQMTRYVHEAEASRGRLEAQAQQLSAQAAELEMAREEALESVRLKSVFLATMSHEIRTPVNGIVGMTNILEETELTQEQREYLETVRISAESLLAIINDILDFSKIEAGKLTFESIEFDLVECVEEAVELLAERAASKGVELSVFIEPSSPAKVVGDPGRLRQILLNLLSNAVKFTDKGEVAVEVRASEHEGSTAMLYFSVRDTGIGISQEAAKRLFGAFMQADDSTTRKYGGTGLGLAISRQLAERMGGEIGVHSERGKGSTFWFTARLGAEPAADGAAESNRPLAGRRVLVYSPNGAARSSIESYLELWGADVTAADSPLQALRRLRGEAQAGRPVSHFICGAAARPADVERLTRVAKRLDAAARVVRLSSPAQRSEIEQAARLDAAVVYAPIRRSRLLSALLGDSVKTASPAAQARTTQRTQPAKRTKPAAPADAKPILVAEDNAVNRLVVTKMLEKLGHHNIAVCNGLEAVEAVREDKYRLVLMDCQMPEMDGFEATRKIREERGERPLPILALTANAMQGDRERCLEAGMDDYLTKPIRLKELAAAIDKWS